MNKVNYQKELDRIIAGLGQQGEPPRLLLHVCCAPCSSYCLEYLSEYFDITVYYYNPNISKKEEYLKRLAEEERYIVVLERRENYVLLITAFYIEYDHTLEKKVKEYQEYKTESE